MTTPINPHIFREFSIRGIATQDLTDEIVHHIGLAIGAFFTQRQKHNLALGRDVRLSSSRISQALIAGLTASGINVTDLGETPTPTLNFATDFYGFDGGVMVTASHNPADYNGLKIRADETLHGDDMQEIYWLTTTPPPAAATNGRVYQKNPFPDYLARLKTYAVDGRSLKLVVDGGNGTNGRIAVQLLTELGHDVVELFCEPDGRFPNRSPDPTDDGALNALSQTILETGADLGIAYDGDGDRLIAVDELGRAILGDQLLMLLARDALRSGPTPIVYEVLCTQAVADDVTAHGGTPIMTPSGYFFIQQAVQTHQAALGGEMSGHIFVNEPDFQFDDAFLATIKLLNVTMKAKRPLSELVADLPSYHASPEIRLPCPDEAKSRIVAQVKEKYENDYKLETIDGTRIHFPEGWALVRQSNTQPVISMRFEAHTAVGLEKLQNAIQSEVEAYISQTKEQ